VGFAGIPEGFVSFERPTLPEIVDRVQADFVSRLSLVGAVLRRSVVYVLSRVVAGAAHMLHGHLEWTSRQLFADTADEAYLLRIGSLFGVERTAAAFAEGTVTLTGTNGSIIPAGTVLLRSDGAEYTTDAQVTISGGTATAAITASEAGEDGTLGVGVSLSFESPIPGVDSTGTVASSTQDGTDQEAVEDYRTRVVDRMRSPPHGGTETDYVAWAKEVSGVTRAWVYPGANGAGSVVIRFVRDNDVSPIPDSGEVTSVQEYIDDRRPVTAAVTVMAPTSSTLDFDVTITPNNSATRAAVEAELRDLLDRVAEPGGTILLSDVETAVRTAAGVTDRTVNDPTADVVLATGQFPIIGTVTFS
jgi:uncharacterized phage protein gp47/JayE